MLKLQCALKAFNVDEHPPNLAESSWNDLRVTPLGPPEVGGSDESPPKPATRVARKLLPIRTLRARTWTKLGDARATEFPRMLIVKVRGRNPGTSKAESSQNRRGTERSLGHDSFEASIRSWPNPTELQERTEDNLREFPMKPLPTLAAPLSTLRGIAPNLVKSEARNRAAGSGPHDFGPILATSGPDSNTPGYKTVSNFDRSGLDSD